MLSPVFKNTECVEVVDFLQTLVKAKSITPDDAGTLNWLSEQLGLLGFEIERIHKNGVNNLIASRHFGEGPKL
ncbi:MAG: succinyl-diaminopimelate desuccinylase, partial [Pseudomonadota bacterium]